MGMLAVETGMGRKAISFSFVRTAVYWPTGPSVSEFLKRIIKLVLARALTVGLDANDSSSPASMGDAARISGSGAERSRNDG